MQKSCFNSSKAPWFIKSFNNAPVFFILTFIDNISGISPTVIFGNKIQNFFLVTSDVTSDIWTVTSYVTDRSPVGV